MGVGWGFSRYFVSFSRPRTQYLVMVTITSKLQNWYKVCACVCLCVRGSVAAWVIVRTRNHKSDGRVTPFLAVYHAVFGGIPSNTSYDDGTPTNISAMSPEGAASNCGYPANLSGSCLGAPPLTLAGVPLITRGVFEAIMDCIRSRLQTGEIKIRAQQGKCKIK